MTQDEITFKFPADGRSESEEKLGAFLDIHPRSESGGRGYHVREADLIAHGTTRLALRLGSKYEQLSHGRCLELL
jgi:hypothetical protein